MSVPAITLIALMAIGSAILWLGLPFGWIWIASQLENGTNPSIGPYALVALGLPVSMMGLGKVLAELDRMYARVTGYDPNDRPMHVPWLKSMRGERGSARRHTVLDVVMIVSVAVAGGLFLVWFLLFAHSAAALS
jgi:hypothetical protein